MDSQLKSLSSPLNSSQQSRSPAPETAAAGSGIGGFITDVEIQQGLADGTSGTISDEGLEEDTSYWAD